MDAVIGICHQHYLAILWSTGKYVASDKRDKYNRIITTVGVTSTALSAMNTVVLAKGEHLGSFV